MDRDDILQLLMDNKVYLAFYSLDLYREWCEQMGIEPGYTTGWSLRHMCFISFWKGYKFASTGNPSMLDSSFKRWGYRKVTVDFFH